MNNKTLELLWLGAFRYYLGRRTYAVSEFCECLIQNWKDVPDITKRLIQKELEVSFEKDDRMRRDNRCCCVEDKAQRSLYLPLGDACDRAEWELVRSLYK